MNPQRRERRERHRTLNRIDQMVKAAELDPNLSIEQILHRAGIEDPREVEVVARRIREIKQSRNTRLGLHRQFAVPDKVMSIVRQEMRTHSRRSSDQKLSRRDEKPAMYRPSPAFAMAR